MLALASAAAFGVSGSFAKSLLEIGWTPGAVVLVRIGGAALVLLVPAVLLLQRAGWPTPPQSRRVVAYGITAVAGAQLCFFSAVQYLSVGVALLLEYTAPVLLIGWQWWRTRRRPAPSVLVGAAVAMAGMVLVLDVLGGLKLHPVGVLWGLGAAVGLCAYFLLSDDSDSIGSIHPLLMTVGGTGVGALAVAAFGLLGLLPMRFVAAPTMLVGTSAPWWLPVLLLVTVSAAFAYLVGIAAVRRLGSSIASLVSLSEVVFAVVFAIVLLDQELSVPQTLGGALVLAGIAIVQRR